MITATKNNNHGFSLIELLVVITIIGVLSGVGLLAFSNIQAQQQLEKAYIQLKTDLNEAREFAFLSKKPTAHGKTAEEVCPNLDGYVFRIIDSKTYAVVVKCGTFFAPIKTVALDAGINITPNSQEFMFTTLTRATGLDPALMLTISNNAGTSKIITIDSAGEIHDVED